MKKTEDCFLKIKNKYLKFVNKEQLNGVSFPKKIHMLKNFYIPLSFWINEKFEKKKNKTLILGLAGGQGAGKTTVAEILKIILKIFFKKRICIISIDDFYKTRDERKKMSLRYHKLLMTRGVPGTHDTKFIENFFKLLNKSTFKKTKLPKFDKSIDNRLKKSRWISINKKPQIVILEGWCVGATSQKNQDIKKPLNLLEREEDRDLIWRNYVNDKLKKNYKKVFKMINHFIYMKVPNFKMVIKWRSLQEHKLKMKKRKKTHLKIMSHEEINRFVMFYQRITLQMMKDLSKSASVVLIIKKNHEINKMFFKS